MPRLTRSSPAIVCQVFAVLFSGLLSAASHAASASSKCEQLVIASNKGIVLEEGGRFCLANDIDIANAGVFVAHGRDRPAYAIDLRSDGVTLDLQGHVVDYGNTTSGISITHKGRGRPIVIRNGTLRATKGRGIGSGFYNGLIPSDMGDPLDSMSTSDMSPAERVDLRRQLNQLDEAKLRTQGMLRPATADQYRDRHILLEDLHIVVPGMDKGAGAGGGAINLEGGKTTIRNCIIETNDGTAIWLFGPNALIENNTIIVSGAHRLREADAAIRLIQADGAIVRNNKIIIKGKANRRAIAVFDTGAITVENNTLVGISSDDEWAKAFIGTLQMKKDGNTFEPGWKFLFR